MEGGDGDDVMMKVDNMQISPVRESMLVDVKGKEQEEEMDVDVGDDGNAAK